jgi:hypothetical protein
MDVAPQDQSRPETSLPRWIPPAAFILGVVGLAAVVVIVIEIPTPTDSQSKVFWTIMALAGAAFAGALTGFISLRLSLPAAGGIVAGGSLAVFGVIYFVSPAGAVSSTPRVVVPGEVSNEQGAFLIVDKELRTYFDRARDLKDAYTFAGKDAFTDAQTHLRISNSIREYNQVREELAKNHEQYVFAIERQVSKTSGLGSRVDALLNQVESFHRDCVLPLNDLGKAMDKLVGKTGADIERERDEQSTRLLVLTSRIESELSSAEKALKSLERESEAAL